MTCLYLLPPSQGGIKDHVITLIKGLDKNKYRAIVVAPPSKELEQALLIFEHSFIPLGWDNKTLNKIKLIKRISKIINSYQVDIMHTHGYKIDIIGKAALHLSNKQVKVITTLHNFYPKKFNNPIVRFGMDLLYRRSDHIITVSNALKNHINLKRKEKVSVIYNGVDVNQSLSPNERYSVSEKRAKIIGTVARLSSEKGIDILIRAFSQLKHKFSYLELIIVGSGPREEALRQLVKSLNLTESIYFTGWQQETTKCLEKIDIFVMPSRSEGLSIATIEAMMAKKPIVATNTGGLVELIDHRETGILVEPNNVEQLGEGIEQLLVDSDLRGKTSINAQSKAVDRFTSELMVANTKRIYEKVMKKVNL